MAESVSNWNMVFGRILVVFMKKDIAIRLSRLKQAYSSLEVKIQIQEKLMNIFQKAPLHGLRGRQKFLAVLVVGLPLPSNLTKRFG